ncbi:hypothetical protein EHQ12_18520 [Leptospira gomenensis]|nr:hypothetical protein EHQ12_18520 [Leptospira gomenensis]
MIQRKIHIPLKIALLSSFVLLVAVWSTLRRIGSAESSPESPWLTIPESSLIERAETEGKRILFLVEPSFCSDCESIRKKFESSATIQDRFLFTRIEETTQKERYEAVLLDDRLSEKIPLLSAGKGFWGIRNASDEILFLSQGVFGETEERLLLESAQNKKSDSGSVR